jgi:hypothetical protein
MRNYKIQSNHAAALRADRDEAAISSLLGIDTETTFFPHGTEVLESAKQAARADRADFLALPGLEEGMDALRAKVQREGRADHWADLGGCFVDSLGRVVAEKDLRTETEIPRLVPSTVGWQSMAMYAPRDIAQPLRSNVNAWAGRVRGKEVRLRTRDTADGTARELYAVVSQRYVPYDLDAIASDVARLLPADARVRVRYDRQRARIDVVLCNPHHFQEGGDTASVGEAHRLVLRIETADDGTGGFVLTWAVERVRCINMTLLRGERTVLRARHTRKDLAEVVETALAAQGEVAERFAATWRDAWQSYYLDLSAKTGRLDGLEALKRMVFHGLVKIPGLEKADVWSAVRDAWNVEPGDSVASVHNAITRAAHQAPANRRSRWADDETESVASALLYQEVRSLAPIRDADLARLDW